MAARWKDVEVLRRVGDTAARLDDEVVELVRHGAGTDHVAKRRLEAAVDEVRRCLNCRCGQKNG